MRAIWFILPATIVAAGEIPTEALPLGKTSVVFPDYADAVIPPNIAPLNFMVRESGEAFTAVLSGGEGALVVRSRDGKIRFPLKRWRRFLQENAGRKCVLNVYVRRNGRWFSFEPVTITVSIDPIDETLVYRLIDPAYHLWTEMGIYQRRLTDFRESLIMTNRSVKNACLNCHSFCGGDPSYFLFHLRGGPGTALVLGIDGDCRTTDTRTAFNSSPGAYRCWHPGGRYIAFSVNKISQFFHAFGENRDVYDLASDLILYDTQTNTVSGCPQIADPAWMETYPMWTPDGRTLYFCAAPQEDFSDELNIPYDRIKYSLKRISFSPEENRWGQVETVIDAGKTGLSVTHPSVSPDGRFLLFCMTGYGNFTIYKRDSDLYLMNLETGRWEALPINSPLADSYHSWSRNSRWFVFSSKRENGVLAQPFFAHIDQDGRVDKPFVLPQKEPDFYLTFLKTFNVPELVTGPVSYGPHQLTRAAYQKARKAQLDPVLKSIAQPQTPEVTPWQPSPQ